MKAGVYAYRTRKPGARWNLPVLSRHWGYVGETTSLYHRHQQHIYGLSSHGSSAAQPWADLDPVRYHLPLPGWKWLLRAVETLAILALAPVYNHSKNLWNPRRIPLAEARRQRRVRDRGRLPVNLRLAHFVLLGVLVGLVSWWVSR